MNNHSQPDVREAKLFRNNRSQAVRIPADFELEGDSVLMRREGPRLIIEPVPSRNLKKLLATLGPLPPADRLPDVDGTLGDAEPVNL